MIEVVVTDNDSQRFTACGSVLVLIEFFEYGTLIPGGSPEFFKGFSEQLFGDVEYSYLEVSRGVGGGNKIIESAPYSLNFQKIGMVNDEVYFLSYLYVGFGNE